MGNTTAHGRRRIDRMVSADYLLDIEAQPVAQLRTLRDECREEEEHLSYARRVLQAQLDIVRTEAARRAGGDETDPLLASLPSVLADPPATEPRDPRAMALHVPDLSGKRAGDLDAPDTGLSRLPDLSDAEIANLIGRLAEQEAQVSQQRRIVLEHIDRIQSELVRRYRDEGLAIDDVVAGVTPR
jgi:hypothetical protein